MANYTPEDLNTNGVIPNQTLAPVMRNSLENKNLLSEKNSMYVGTGTTNSVAGGDDTYDVAVTDAISPPTDSTNVLMLPQGNASGNLAWRQINLSEVVDDSSTSPIDNATNAVDATNVTTNINGNAITSIFESDGVTVKNATNATNLLPDENGAINPSGRGSDSIGANSTAIGGSSTAAGSSATSYGFGAKAPWSNALSIGANSSAGAEGAIAIGYQSKVTGTTADTNGIAIGTNAFSSYGGDSVAIGHSVKASGGGDIVIGANATTEHLLLGGNSTVVGTSAAATSGAIAIGYRATAGGLSSTVVGNSAAVHDDMSVAYGASTIVGANANAYGAGITAVGHKTSIGSDGSSVTNSMALGYEAAVTQSNTIQLGNDQISQLKCQVQLTTTSDERDKADVSDITDALSFVNKLKPITYVANDRVKYISEEDKKSEIYRKYGMCEYDREAHKAGLKKGTRRRCGLLAQEVIKSLNEVYGTDNYANIVNDNFYDLKEKPEDVENQYTLAYSNLIPFLIGAIQEQQIEIKNLQSKLEELELQSSNK